MADEEAEEELNGEPSIEFSPEELPDSRIWEFIERFAKDISIARDRPLLYLLYPSAGMISQPDALSIYQEFLMNENEIENLDILLHSSGGDIHEAYDIIKLCQNHVQEDVSVLVPLRAMSAATLIALGADNIVLSEIGKLGPLDPQVPHPNTGEYLPVRSFTDIPRVLEEGLVPSTKDISPDIKGEHIVTDKDN